MQINPRKIIENGVLTPCEFTRIQQVGVDLTVSEEVKLLPGKSKNVLLNESVKLPKDIYSTFIQRSSLSRRGIFLTTGVFDPGFEGAYGCTLYNLGDGEITIAKNDRVGQALFFKADAASEYSGQWQGLGLQK